MKPLLPSQLCTIFFTLGDIWFLGQNSIDTKLLWNARTLLEQQKKYLNTEERDLYPLNPTDDFVAGKDLISTKILDFITWVHPSTIHGYTKSKCLQMTINIYDFEKNNTLSYKNK